MLTLIFCIFSIFIFGQLLIFALKAAWSISKIFLTVFLLPLVLMGLAAAGLFVIAVPFLIVAGIIIFCVSAIR
ncbi:MAG: hypothetical protein PUB22_06200 [Clostridiales bacterium]|nr:hypothetical protein [Clostridiales bacterium]